VPGPPSLRIVACGPERAQDVHRLTQAAFAAHRVLDPPSGAGRELPATVRADLEAGGGAIAEQEGRPVGCLRWVVEDGAFRVRRVAVAPDLQRSGVGSALMRWAEREALRRGFAVVALGVRLGLPGNLAFYRRLGYAPVAERRHDGYAEPTWLELEKRLARRRSPGTRRGVTA
jgi:GNAT superfamily N-acetyltransferase